MQEKQWLAVGLDFWYPVITNQSAINFVITLQKQWTKQTDLGVSFVCNHDFWISFQTNNWDIQC